MLANPLIIKYFTDKARTLSLEFSQQQKIAFELGLGDYFTEDVANDWLTDDIIILEQLKNEGIIDSRVIEIYSLIDKNFINASLYGGSFEEEIWTLVGLENHPFWTQQRKLAKELLYLLQV